MVFICQLVVNYDAERCDLCTWQMSRQGAGSRTDLSRVARPVNIISFDFEQFNLRLFSSAQLCTCMSSLVLLAELAADTTIGVISKLN